MGAHVLEVARESLSQRGVIQSCTFASMQVNSHSLLLAVFASSSCHIAPFDPRFGADMARIYAGKYAAKPEKHYYLEATRDSVRDFLKCRTIGTRLSTCATHSVATAPQ